MSNSPKRDAPPRTETAAPPKPCQHFYRVDSITFRKGRIILKQICIRCGHVKED